MSFAGTAAILDAIRTRIETLTPREQASAEDVFEGFCETQTVVIPDKRAVTISGTAGIRKIGGNRNCTEWQTTITITQAYNDAATDLSQNTVTQRAIQDCEDILADLYTWAVTTDGIYMFEPDPAQAQDAGENILEITRTIRINFGRT